MLSLLAGIQSAKFAIAASIVLSCALTPLARAVARRLGVVDEPNEARKQHGRSVPLWGGAAVYLALAGGLLVACLSAAGTAAFQQLATTVILASGLVCVVGCIDDSVGLNARFKLSLQIASVLPVVFFGYYFDRIVVFGYPIELGWWGIPLTVAWLVGCINALNLLDGLDGLASLIGICASLMMAVIAAHTGQVPVSIVALLLGGALTSFLIYNLPPASIFLGDSGSMVIGLVLGMISIQGAMKTSATLSITVPALVMCVPMLDTVFAIARRKLSGQRFDAADRGHIHHRLLERGLSDWQTLWMISGLCVVTGTAATLATLLRIDSLGWITALVMIVLLVRTRIFGHHETALATERLSATFARLWQPLHNRFHGITSSRGVPSWETAWNDLLADVARRGAGGFELLLAHDGAQVRYSWRTNSAPLRRPLARPVVLACTRPDKTFCQLQLLDLRSDDGSQETMPPLAGLLEALARHWRSTGEIEPPETLGIECHYIPTGSARRAA